MGTGKTGFTIGQLIRIPLVLFTLFLLLILGKSSINLITSFAVPFGFTTGTTTAFTTVAVVFYLSIGILAGLHIFKTND